MNIHSIDQSYSHAQEGLDKVVQEWRDSLKRKQERHGDKYDHTKTLSHLYSMLQHADGQSLAMVAAAAIDRLATMPDPELPDELAHLDFDIDLNKEGDE